MPTRATFVSHSVQPDGLRIEATTGRGLIPDVEVFVPREEAEQFGWVDPEQGGEDDSAPSALQEQVDHLEGLLLNASHTLAPIYKDRNLQVVDECIDAALWELIELKRTLGLKQLQSEEAAR